MPLKGETSPHLKGYFCRSLPILGHLHLLKPPLHCNLHRLCQISGGPIISLKLGVRRAVVVSSPDLVEECFTKNNDVVFANRPNLLVDKYLGYNHTTMIGASHSELWRSLRRIGAQKMLSTGRFNAFVHIRQDEIKRLISNLYKLSTPGGVGFSKVEMRPKLYGMMFNVIMRTMGGKRYFGGDQDDKEEGSTEEAEGRRFQNVIRKVFELSEASNPQDFLPLLRWIDYGGFTKKMRSAAKEMDEFFQGLVDEHRLEKMNTMIGDLLAQQESQPRFYSDQIIKGFLMESKLEGSPLNGAVHCTAGVTMRAMTLSPS
ncbi:hypothetical protein BUALT_Bualt02G0006600 [Buddleja alternifolia]|uniref:Cytochrome P450 n=1 Tax=Buddleja alternifolia TaxID=168488 RepID=A0AAV6XWG9_9LAMI|nr:hypothetical protein BUALT_Bualt02G0006600 [Buddleja alternifolia]